MEFVATCAKHLEQELGLELSEFGIPDVTVGAGAVRFSGEYEAGMRALLGSRLASRVLLVIESLPSEPEDLYAAARELRWQDVLPDGATFAINAVGAKSVLHSPRYMALKLKDALVDSLRDSRGHRPDVDTHSPDLRFHLYLGETAAQLSVDLSGAGMHRRGYRPKGAAAPLKESLASAVLRLAHWPERAKEGLPLVDPMCGSGTLLIEAGLMAMDVAPGIGRKFHGCERYAGHDTAAFDRVMRELEERAHVGCAHPPKLYGYDASDESLRLCRESARNAGVEVTLARRGIDEAAAPEGVPPGLVVTNPPYGERLGDARELFLLYEALGDALKRRFAGYHAFVLTGEPSLGKRLGLRPAARHVLFNGDLECRLLDVPISGKAPTTDHKPRWRGASEESSAYAGRLEKNVVRLGRWAAREGIEAYRVYDRDVPEYNVAVDVYGKSALVSEYAPPRSVDEQKAQVHLRDVIMLTPELLGLPEDDVHLRVRKRQTEGGQYGKRDEEPSFTEVREGGLRFLVDLRGHLDAGLFLDHRLLRARLRDEAEGKRFLNLYAYTCTASVYAAAGGARSTTSVDLSGRYLDWGQENFERNGFEARTNSLVEDDCADFIERHRGSYDLIFLNPPSYSRSRRMRGDLDIIRDHARLIRQCTRLLANDGVLYFSTHARGFELDVALERGLAIEDISKAMTPVDFQKSAAKIFRIQTLSPAPNVDAGSRRD